MRNHRKFSICLRNNNAHKRGSPWAVSEVGCQWLFIFDQIPKPVVIVEISHSESFTRWLVRSCMRVYAYTAAYMHIWCHCIHGAVYAYTVSLRIYGTVNAHIQCHCIYSAIYVYMAPLHKCCICIYGTTVYTVPYMHIQCHCIYGAVYVYTVPVSSTSILPCSPCPLSS